MSHHVPGLWLERSDKVSRSILRRVAASVVARHQNAEHPWCATPDWRSRCGACEGAPAPFGLRAVTKRDNDPDVSHSFYRPEGSGAPGGFLEQAWQRRVIGASRSCSKRASLVKSVFGASKECTCGPSCALHHCLRQFVLSERAVPVPSCSYKALASRRFSIQHTTQLTPELAPHRSHILCNDLSRPFTLSPVVVYRRRLISR